MVCCEIALIRSKLNMESVTFIVPSHVNYCVITLFIKDFGMTRKECSVIKNN